VGDGADGAQGEDLVAAERKAREDAEKALKEAEERESAERKAREEAEKSRNEADERAKTEGKARAEAEKAQKRSEKEVRKADQAATKSEQQAIALSARTAEQAARAGVPRQVALSAQWESSSARSKARANVVVFGTGALVLMLVAIGLGVAALDSDMQIAASVGGAGAALFIAIVLIAAGFYVYVRRHARFLSVREEAIEARKNAVDGRQDEDLDELLNINRNQMQAYQTLSSRQQRSAFRSSLMAMFVGLVVLVGGIVVVLLAESDTAKIAVAGVSAIGSGLSGYIANTYLSLQRESSNQLRFFSDQPIVASYIYEAERLISKLPGANAKQSAAYESVIKEILGIARSDAAMLASTAQAVNSMATLGSRRRGGKRENSSASKAAKDADEANPTQ